MNPAGGNQKTLTISLDEDLFYKLMELHISPAAVVKRALKDGVRRIQGRLAREERESGLRAVQEVDPRAKGRDLKSSSYRIHRLRRMASVYEPPRNMIGLRAAFCSRRAPTSLGRLFYTP